MSAVLGIWFSRRYRASRWQQQTAPPQGTVKCGSIFVETIYYPLSLTVPRDMQTRTQQVYFSVKQDGSETWYKAEEDLPSLSKWLQKAIVGELFLNPKEEMDLTLRGLSVKIHVDTLVSYIIQIKTPQNHKSCERKSPKILIFPFMIIQSSFLEISIFFKKVFSPFFFTSLPCPSA